MLPKPARLHTLYICVDFLSETIECSHSIAKARRYLPRLIREAESGHGTELTRRGESVAVLIGRRWFDRIDSRRPNFVDACRDFATDIDFTELGLDPDELFGNLRERMPGRGLQS